MLMPRQRWGFSLRAPDSTIDLGYTDTGGLIQQVHGPLAGLDLIRI